jgi:hypothetical protein
MSIGTEAPAEFLPSQMEGVPELGAIMQRFNDGMGALFDPERAKVVADTVQAEFQAEMPGRESMADLLTAGSYPERSETRRSLGGLARRAWAAELRYQILADAHDVEVAGRAAEEFMQAWFHAETRRRARNCQCC